MTEADIRIAELVGQLEREFPDPVDLFEDELAAQLGLFRHPTCQQQAWRRHRVAAIDADSPDPESDGTY